MRHDHVISFELPDPEHLVDRIVDGEADDAAYAAFARRADTEPSLWRTLAERQREMQLLSAAVRAETAFADRIPLPTAAPAARRIVPSRVTWPLALAGWAAVVTLMVSWIMAVNLQRPVDPGIATVSSTPVLSPEDCLRRYLNAPYVLGDLPAEVVETQALPDGRLAVRFVRRIEEVAFLEPGVELPEDDEGRLIADPAVLRAADGGPNGR